MTDDMGYYLEAAAKFTVAMLPMVALVLWRQWVGVLNSAAWLAVTEKKETRSATNTYDTSNRLTSDGTRTFTWDGADRLTQRGSDTFAYDALGRLTSSTVGGGTRTYAYNGDGLLASRTEGPNTTSFLWISRSPLRKPKNGMSRTRTRMLLLGSDRRAGR